MKTHVLNQFLSIAALAFAPFAQAAFLTWDANGTGTGQTNGAGAWLGTNVWWSGSANQDWVAGSDAIFGGPSTAGGAVTVGAVSASTVQLNTFTGTYTLQGTATTLTQSGGITIGAGAGNVTFRGTKATTEILTISGAGGITMNGPGLLNLRENLVLSYTGATEINNGVVMIHGNKSAGNFKLNGGMLTDYYQTTYAFTSGLGTGNNQIQITGNSGFGAGNGGSTWRIGASGSVLIWGTSGENGNINTTGFFNPTSLKFLTSADNMGTSIYGQVTLDNGIDLNGAARTAQVLAASGTKALTTSWGKIGGVISGSTGSLIKTGGGNLLLSAANTYGGGTTINQGNVRFTSLTAMPPAGNVTVNTSATLTVELGGAGDWTGGTSGVGTLGGLFSGLGSAGTSTVSFSGDATLGLDMTGNITYAADLPNLGSNLSIIKTGGSSLTLTGNNSYSGKTWVHTGTLSFNSIANISGGPSALGAPATAPNGTISIGSDGATVTLAYTGSGHTSNRVIHLPAASGTATLDASGSGPLVLTSSITAGAGAKTLALTGTNTAANTLGSSAIPGLADVLTITKNGAGTWWVNGFSSPKNAWSVNAGTLVASGNITAGDQNFTVSGGTLAGLGPIILQSGKLLTIQAAGSLAPGNLAVGNLALTGNLSVSAMAAGTGKLNFQIGAPAASDKITVTGNAQIGTGVLGFSDFVFTDMGGITPGTYVLISTTTGITGTLDPANRSGLIGTINGTLRINGNNLEWSTDQDLDGIPDVYELANTAPPSATSFNPGDDLDTDGSTNLQEYIAGTNPNLFDTDADGIRDGYETNTGTWVSATNTGTNPLALDSDGDTIRDGYETNDTTFNSTTDTGTNPNKTDSDADSLADNVETRTGVFVSKTNTGTDPNDADTDNDNAGDWYEVTASFTSPFLAGEKPNVPYPLPDPDTSTGNPSKKVKVYIMSGQSNMVGMGLVAGTDEKSLESMTLRQNKFPNLVDAAGAWTTRQDVQYRGVVTDVTNAKLSGGSLGAKFGPELGFGQVMGWYHDGPVLLIKSCDGNRALSWDILPHGTPSWVYGTTNYAGYGDFGNWPVGGTPPTSGGWYAGKEFDRFFKHESEWARPDVANTNVVDVLDDFAGQYPDWAAQGFEIAGFVWWQGEKDGGDLGWATQYEPNLVRLINSLRSYYTNRYPGKVVANAPFVLATLGEAALTNTSDAREVAVRNAHFAVDSATGSNPQINVKTVYSHPLSEGGSGNGHYGDRAGTYMLVGDALGRAMIDLQPATTGNTYANWIATFPGAASMPGFDQDADGDGIDNGAENFFGTNPGIGSSGLVGGATGSSTFTFTHPQNATPATGVTAAYRWSKDLAIFRNHGETDGSGTTVNFNAVTAAGITTVTATVTGTPTAKLFVDVKVLQN
jgi:autotransporter-associated beta strand protein